jgi:FPC/CPF motif-containing protein YcgG
MNEAGLETLLDQETFAERATTPDAPEWVHDHWTAFERSMTRERNDTPFPCFFGVEAFENADLLYTACRSMTDRDSLWALRETLLEYLAVFEEYGERTPLVTFFAPPERPLTEAEYHGSLWHVLQFLHVHDPEPWPRDIPTDPDDPRWEFCFGGEPIFPTCRAPFYDDRQSRYCPVGLEITFQPRAVFEGVTADTEAGQRAREVIQGRLEAYDGVCPHADLGDWGVEGDREWLQYLFHADPDQQPAECPLTITADEAASASDRPSGPDDRESATADRKPEVHRL